MKARTEGMSINHFLYEWLVERYGEPILRFKPHGTFTEDEIMTGDIPEEISVFKIPHVSEYMVLRKLNENKWFANSGERWVIRELLFRRQEMPEGYSNDN